MTRTRLTAAERSEQLVDAAITAFAKGGYAGTRPTTWPGWPASPSRT